MCGICGYTGPSVPGLLSRMTDAVRHRGPDSEGRFETDAAHLGVRRLRILDVEGGDQPIFNEDRSVVLVYNGEIYNFASLRAELEERGHRFATRTDSEVVVHLYEEEGLGCARRLEGMFAFALYDLRRRRWLLARDPVGIKPLLYAWTGGRLVFASEAKAVLLHPAVSPALDPVALHDLLNVRFVAGPRTLFAGIHQLPPGHTLVLEDGEDGAAPAVAAYHRFRLDGDADLSREDAADRFLDILTRAVERQRVADVPVGLFLSGGLDSSALLAAAARGSRPAMRTFTLGFGEPTDELDDAAVAARRFGSDHRATTLEPRPLELLPRIVHHAEMPKVNALQGYCLSRFARREVTVALSGLGGDELFYGYELYRYLGPARLLVDGPLAGPLRRLAPAFDGLAAGLARIGGLRAETARRALDLAASAEDPLRYYLTLRNAWDLGGADVGGGREIYAGAWRGMLDSSTRTSFAGLFDRPDLPFAEQVQWAELRGKMVDDFLLNEDRMSMANSLEVRVPLLDVEMVDFALSLPFRIKHEGRRLKPVMRRALAPILPSRLVDKRKRGFAFDSYALFRRELRERAARELTPGFLAEQGIFEPRFVQAILDHPPSPRLRWHYFLLWQILGLKLWQEIFLDGRSVDEVEARFSPRGPTG